MVGRYAARAISVETVRLTLRLRNKTLQETKNKYKRRTMSKEKRASLPIAVRAYPQHQKEERPARTRPEKTWIRPDAMLVVDTETKNDATQAIKVGSYRLVVSGNCVEEGLFYPPDISEEEKQILNNYVSSRATQPPKK